MNAVQLLTFWPPDQYPPSTLNSTFFWTMFVLCNFPNHVKAPETRYGRRGVASPVRLMMNASVGETNLRIESVW